MGETFDEKKLDAWWNNLDVEAKTAVMKIFSHELPEAERAEAREALGDLLNEEREVTPDKCPITVHSVARRRTKGANETVYDEDYIELEKQKKKYWKHKKEAYEEQLGAEDMGDRLQAARDIIASGMSLNPEILQLEKQTQISRLKALFFKQEYVTDQIEAAAKLNRARVQQFEKLLNAANLTDSQEIVGARKFLGKIVEGLVTNYKLNKVAKDVAKPNLLTKMEI